MLTSYGKRKVPVNETEHSYYTRHKDYVLATIYLLGSQNRFPFRILFKVASSLLGLTTTDDTYHNGGYEH